jgi:hypothetical protein
LTDDDRGRVKQQLQVQQSNLASQLAASMMQLYGIASPDPATIGAEVGAEGHIFALLSGPPTRLHGGAGWETNLFALTDDLFARLYPQHPDFDPTVARKALTTAEVRTVLQCVTRAMENRDRRVELERAQLPLVRRVIHGLDLGEVSDGPLVVSPEWRRKIDQHAAQRGIAGDFAVEDLRRWIGELGGEGLDPLVVNLIIATYALLADRGWVRYGTAQAEAPPLDKIGTGWSLREPELPTDAEFTVARHRAEVLFGVKVPEVLFTRNVQRLAADVLAKVDAWEGPLTRMRELLGSHADDLGLDVEASARGRSSRETAELLAGLRGATTATALVRVLAGPVPDGALTDEVRARTASSAGEVSRAMETMRWSQLESLREIVEQRDDTAGISARTILDQLAKDAALTEFERPLAPVLETATKDGWRLIQSLIVVTTLALPAPVPLVPPNPPERLVVPPDPSLPPALEARARVSASALEATLGAMLVQVQADVESWLAKHPGQDVDVNWHVSAPTDQAG